MRRREFIGLIGGVVSLWPGQLRAQRSTIGWLNNGSRDTSESNLASFQQGLRDGGYRAKISSSNTDGLTFNWIVCLNSRPTWFVAECWSLPERLAFLLFSSAICVATANESP
jgi:hypothetical protein